MPNYSKFFCPKCKHPHNRLEVIEDGDQDVDFGKLVTIASWIESYHCPNCKANYEVCPSCQSPLIRINSIAKLENEEKKVLFGKGKFIYKCMDCKGEFTELEVRGDESV